MERRDLRGDVTVKHVVLDFHWSRFLSRLLFVKIPMVTAQEEEDQDQEESPRGGINCRDT